MLIKDVSLLRSDQILSGCDMLIEEGNILKIGQGLKDGSDDEAVDGRGKLAIPGLINRHTHLASLSSPGTDTGRYVHGEDHYHLQEINTRNGEMEGGITNSISLLFMAQRRTVWLEQEEIFGELFVSRQARADDLAG